MHGGKVAEMQKYSQSDSVVTYKVHVYVRGSHSDGRVTADDGSLSISSAQRPNLPSLAFSGWAFRGNTL